MRLHARLDKDSGLIHSVVVTAANVHALTPAADLLHGDEQVVYADAGYQGIAKRPEKVGMTTEFRVAMRPGKRRVVQDTSEGRLIPLRALEPRIHNHAVRRQRVTAWPRH
jgi:IS5 family transposase